MADAPHPLRWRTTLHCLGVAACYAATGKAGLLLAFAGSNVSPVFPASGVAVAAVLLGGWWMLPGVWLGALVLNLTGMPAALAPWVATGNTAETAAVVALLRMVGWSGPADRVRDVLALAGAAAAGAVVAALNGITALASAGLIPWAAFPDAWWTWWLGDVMGILVATPAIVAWGGGRRRGALPWRLGEGAALAGATVAIAFMVFTPFGPWRGGSLPLAYAIFPCVLWGAVRFGARGTTLVAVVVSAVAVAGSVAGFGPFADFPTINERLLALQALLATAVLSGLALAAALHERQRAQDELVRVSLALDRAGDLVLFADADGRVAYANRTARDLLAPIDPVGRPFTTLLGRHHGDDDTPGTGSVREVDLPLPGGGLLPLEVSYSSTPGDPPGIIAIARDLRERRELQGRLARTGAMEAMGRVAGGVAHDFNNLLAVILGYAETARARLDPAHPASPALDHVREAGHTASTLTRQLLAFSRRQVLQPRVLDLVAAVQGARSVIEGLAGHRIALAIEAEGPAWVRADPAQIHQVLLNLVANARDAQPDGGGITIRIGAVAIDAAAARRMRACDPVGAARARAGRWVRLTVEDRGHGMDDAVRQRVFEPFFSTRAGGRGTGLGLSTVHGIVEQSDGFIAIASAPGTGTAMQVHLPAAAAAPAGGGAEDSRLVRAIGRIRVAVCDDQPVIAALVADMLAGDAIAVSAFTGVADLRHALDGGAQFDLLVTDVAMPEGGGAAATAVARAALPGIAVLYISGNPMDHGLDLGGAGFLAKPFDRAALLAAVRDAVAIARP